MNGHFNPKRFTVLHLLNESVDGPQSWSGRFGEQKNLLTFKDLLN